VAGLARRAGALDRDERPLAPAPGQDLGELGGVGGGRGRRHHHRVRPLHARQPQQALEDVVEVRAEDAAVGVELVEDDPLQVAKQR
jgi:hypothetical protein